MRYRAVILDVDGTIIAPGVSGAETLSPRLIDCVTKVQERGIVVSLATARSLDWVQPLIDKLSLKGPQILDNGARVWDVSKKAYVFESFIPQSTAQRALSVMVQYPYPVHFVDHDLRQTYQTDHPASFEKTVKMMMLHLSPEKADEIYHRLLSIGHMQITKSVSGESPIVESIHVTSMDATKEHALKNIAERMEWSLDQIIGIGDSYNDIGFLTICGVKVAMGNAVPEVLRIARYTTDSYERDGVAKILEQLVLSSS